MSVRLIQPEKTLILIVATEAGMVILTSPEHLKKVEASRTVIGGSVTVVRAVQSENALISIFIICGWKFMFEKKEFPLNANAPILVTDNGIV